MLCTLEMIPVFVVLSDCQRKPFLGYAHSDSTHPMSGIGEVAGIAGS